MDSRFLISLAWCCATVYVCAADAPEALDAADPPPKQAAAGTPEAPIVYPIYSRDLKISWAPSTFRFNLLSMEPLTGLYYKVYPTDKALSPYYREVVASGRSRSDTYDYNGPSPLELYWLPPAGQQGAPRLALRHDFSGRQKSMLVLNEAPNAAKTAARPLTFFDVDLSPRAFPAGSYMVINLSNAPLAGCFDGKLYRPLPRVIMPQRKNGDLELDIYAYIEKQARIINVTNSKLWISPNKRYWVCFFPSKSEGGILYSAFYEVMEFDQKADEQMRRQLDDDMKAKR